MKKSEGQLPLVMRDLNVLMDCSETLLCGTYTSICQDVLDSEDLSTHRELKNTDNVRLVSFCLRFSK